MFVSSLIILVCPECFVMYLVYFGCCANLGTSDVLNSYTCFILWQCVHLCNALCLILLKYQYAALNL